MIIKLLIVILLFLHARLHDFIPFYNSESVLPKPLLQAKFYSKPLLILIGGGTSTGKATFSMQVATTLDIQKCISTAIIRQVMRLDQSEFQTTKSDLVKSLTRSTYTGQNDPIIDWLECCNSVENRVEKIIEDSFQRSTSLVLQGSLIKPESKLIDLWTNKGGVAIGTVLYIPDESLHKAVIRSREIRDPKSSKSRLDNFVRIRTIHDEIVKRAEKTNWLVIKQTPSLRQQNLEILNNVMSTL